MGDDSDFDLRALLGLPEEKAAEPTAFAQSMATALTEAVTHMRAEGMVEIEDANVDGVVAEVVDAALESSSLKRLLLRVVKTLIHSDLVAEVYGTDEEISAALRPFLGAS